MKKYLIEITDTFGGDANYSWVDRYVVSANSERGAIQRLSRSEGGGWRKEYSTGDVSRYNLKNACICLFIQLVDEFTNVDQYSRIKEI